MKDFSSVLILFLRASQNQNDKENNTIENNAANSLAENGIAVTAEQIP